MNIFKAIRSAYNRQRMYSSIKHYYKGELRDIKIKLFTLGGNLPVAARVQLKYYDGVSEERRKEIRNEIEERFNSASRKLVELINQIEKALEERESGETEHDANSEDEPA